MLGPRTMVLLKRCWFAWVVLVAAGTGAGAADLKPNIVLILADDLGYGDVRCFHPSGQIPTPNLDRLAAGGMIFTDAHSSSSVCTPTRYGLLTGRYNWRSRLKRGVQGGMSPPLIEPGRLTIGAFLQANGYHTAAIGKWHLGMDWPLQPGAAPFNDQVEQGPEGWRADFTKPIRLGPTSFGFHQYFGIAASLDMVPYVFIEDDRVIRAPTVDKSFPMLLGHTNQTRRGPAAEDFEAEDVLPELTRRAVAYLEQRARAAEPFFLYLPLAAPHTATVPAREWRGKSRLNAYGDFVMQLDTAIGTVLDALDRLGLGTKTLVVFAADNGCSPEAKYPELMAKGHNPSAHFRGTKADLFEGGHRVPFIARWPGRVKAGGRSEQIIGLNDFFATCADLLGRKVPDHAAEDSISFLPLLEGRTATGARDSIVHHSINGSFAIRQGSWKLLLCPGSGGWSAPRPGSARAMNLPAVQLYNLARDIGETNNLATQHPEMIERLNALLEQFVADGRSTPGTPQVNTTPVQIGSGEKAQPFGVEFPKLDSLTVGEWWNAARPKVNPPPPMNVPRDQVIAFALYTHERGVLKLTAQLYPLRPAEAREARLELQRNGRWTEVARTPVIFPGWSAHFRVEPWDGSKTVSYRVRHGENATFAGTIRRDPSDQNEIVVASMSCNSSRTTGLRPEILEALRKHDPDLLFFAGDQTYRHTEHTAGWIEFGLQFREIIRDRPTITIPDDHDVGHPNLWGASGKRSIRKDNADGGYFYPVEYVNMLQRQQTWHLPDPVDPAPIERGIGVYFTRLHVGGVDFAVIEDRKFKSAPVGNVPRQGPRPDHITDRHYDRKSIDRPGLQLLGARQENFLNDWHQDWTGAELKVVLSATAFAGAVHLHGDITNRLIADLDCNGWPAAGRQRALEAIRRARAVHLCGDQHLAVVVKHGLREFGDGPYSFTSPALVNTIYGRWWHPLEEQAGGNPVRKSPLSWTGDYLDGLGNKISMLAYANPGDIDDERQRGDGYAIVRFNKKKRTATFECWPRFPRAPTGRPSQFAGWPITVRMADNDGRKPVAWLPELKFSGAKSSVVQVIADATGEVLYTIRITGTRFQPPVFAPGSYTVKAGADRPLAVVLARVIATDRKSAGSARVPMTAR
jgi:arylsulfatase A-like enzyme